MKGIWDDILCRVWLSRVPLWSTFMMSTYNLVLITADRFAAVMFPVMYRNTNTMIGLVYIYNNNNNFYLLKYHIY